MAEFARARDVHRTLARSFAAWAKPRGFQRVPGSTCAFARRHGVGAGYLRFWIQISQWGESWCGNQFTVNVETHAERPSDMLGGGQRILQQLTADDVSKAEALQQQIIAKIPEPPPTHLIYQWMQLPGRDGEIFRQSYAKAFTHDPALFRPGLDIWLRYFSVADVEIWAHYLAERLPLLVEHLERSAGAGA